jgi:hypothetical protein
MRLAPYQAVENLLFLLLRLHLKNPGDQVPGSLGLGQIHRAPTSEQFKQDYTKAEDIPFGVAITA